MEQAERAEAPREPPAEDGRDELPARAMPPWTV